RGEDLLVLLDVNVGHFSLDLLEGTDGAVDPGKQRNLDRIDQALRDGRVPARSLRDNVLRHEYRDERVRRSVILVRALYVRDQGDRRDGRENDRSNERDRSSAHGYACQLESPPSRQLSAAEHAVVCTLSYLASAPAPVAFRRVPRKKAELA